MVWEIPPAVDHRMHLDNAAKMPIATMLIRQSFSFGPAALDPSFHPIVFSGPHSIPEDCGCDRHVGFWAVLF